MTIGKIVLLFGMAWILVACSGDPLTQEEEANEDGDTLVEDDEETNVSYLSLMTVDKYKEWSGATEDEVLQSYSREPRLVYYTINPVDATTLEPISNAQASDYSITYDGIPINPNVSFPQLQPIIGNQVALRTAIVVNTSSAMDVVGREAFIDEIKDYVKAAKDSSNYFIRNQEFTVWAVDSFAQEVTSGATSIETEILTAIDTLSTGWAQGSYGGNGSNHLYDGVIEAIGRFADESEFGIGHVFRDSLTPSDDDNDLRDLVTPDFISASSIVVFSAGFSTPDAFGEEDFKKALESQSTYIYSPNNEESDVPDSSEESSENLALNALPKPMIYVVPDGEPTDDILKGLAHTVIENTISGGQYSFAADVVQAQTLSIEEKIALGNQHLLRWANPVRTGGKHVQLVETRTADDKFGYTITRDLEYGLPAVDLDMPIPQVEITGGNNEYIATNNVVNIESELVPAYDSATTFANLISTFYPATRWTNQEFSASDYTWSFTPSGSMVENSDGSISIASGATFPIELTLTNNNIVHDGVTISDDFVLTIEETNQ